MLLKSRRWLVAAVVCCAPVLWPATSRAQFLFDATKAEMAGSADWVIDADAHNLRVSSASDGSGTVISGTGDSNPQRVPTPAASGINSGTAETYWNGALSAWGVGLVKMGQSVETLPFNGAITFGNGSNAQDLSHYKVFVIDEPNILFTAAEKTAIINFVHAGGGLFMISDHVGSDRNNDGSDSVDVWNDLLTNNSVASNPFGITFNTASNTDVSGNFTTLDASSTDPVIHGSAGTVTGIQYNDGDTMTVNTSKNSTATAAIFRTSAKSGSDVVVAYATYGLGHVVAVGDSSPADDGSGDPNDTLFNGWTTAGVTDSTVFLNGSSFLSSPVPEPATAILFAGICAALLSRPARRGASLTNAA